ncbi:MAG: hypothetical protein CVV25_01125 [Ignavibacteriae bacterium HGW-Ignavibacteriae-4]|jgi:hypothetical protein|nr:MAG: hypothetical protein CVV25_01125 [Ignavibacteriae bacterium HGW-Ignavibacteriae-4]
MIKKLLILSLILSFQSCSNTSNKVGNIEICESIDGKRIEEINFYFVDFEKLDLEAKIRIKNKVNNKDSVIENDIIKNGKTNKNIVLKVIDVKTAIYNDVIIEVSNLTNLIFKDIRSTEYCVIRAKENDGKIDLSFSFRTSPPDFYVGKKNPYYNKR